MPREVDAWHARVLQVSRRVSSCRMWYRALCDFYGLYPLDIQSGALNPRDMQGDTFFRLFFVVFEGWSGP